MKNNPRISVIVPSYNQGVFLGQCIGSIVKQTYLNWELIVIDGGSTDETIKVIKDHEHLITYWQSKKDKGQTNAINIGFSHAQGDILAWLNSDDRYDSDTLKIVSDHFASIPDLDFLFGDQGIISPGGDLLGTIRSIPYMRHLFMYGGVGFPQPSCFFSRNAFDRVGYLREDLEYQMDTEFFLRFVREKMNIQSIRTKLSDFRLHPDSKTVRTDRKIFMEENFNLRKDLLPSILKSERGLMLLKWVTRLEAYVIRTLTRGPHRPFIGTAK